MANTALISMLVLCALSSDPSEPRSEPSSELTFPVDPREYEVGPGDVLWLTAEGGLPTQLCDSLSKGGIELPVTPDGYVVIPLVGALDLEGMTLAEASEIVERSFRSRFRASQPLVGLARLRRFSVPVTGKVEQPGIYTATAARRVSEALMQAGGITQGGTWDNIDLLRDGDTIRVDVAAYLESGDMRLNPLLAAGDIVNVPPSGPKVGVEGAVSLSNIYESGVIQPEWSVRGFLSYREGERASELLRRAGGLLPRAHASQCYLTRQDSARGELRIPAPMDDESVDPVVLPGDMLICPGSPVTVVVTGHVFEPGPRSYIPGMDAGYYIALAGGVDDEADYSEVRIVTSDGEVYAADELASVPSGSVISVPRAELVWWEDYLAIATGVASVVIAWASVF